MDAGAHALETNAATRMRGTLRNSFNTRSIEARNYRENRENVCIMFA
jgi:hypothetical protein